MNDNNIKRALCKEGCSSLQVVCPECFNVQISFSTMDLYINAPDFLDCEYCNKTMKIAAT